MGAISDYWNRLGGQMTKSNLDRLYNRATSQGWSGSQIDSALGLSGGTSDSWVKSQGYDALTGRAPSTSTTTTQPRTTTTSPTTTTSSTSTTSPRTTSTTQQSSDPISSYWQSTGGQMTQSNLDSLYNQAQSQGWTGSQIDSALGLSGGTADKWISDMGYSALGGSTQQQQQQQPTSSTSFDTSRYVQPGEHGGYTAEGIQEMYQAAQQQGITADYLDQQLGLASGTAAKYISDMGWDPLGGTTTPTGEFDQAGNYWNAKDYLNQTSGGQMTQDSLTNLYNEAYRMGASAETIDQQLGLAPGTTAQWVSDMGYGALTGQTGSAQYYGTGGADAFDFNSYADNLRARGMSEPQIQEAMYAEFLNSGMMPEQVDAQMGWPQGTTLKWIQDREANSGIPTLTGGGYVGVSPGGGAQLPGGFGSTSTQPTVGGGGGSQTPGTQMMFGGGGSAPGGSGGMMGNQGPSTQGLSGFQFDWTTPEEVMGQPNSSMYRMPGVDGTNPYSYAFTRPNLRGVQDADTVAGQLAMLQRQDSDLMQLAARRGMEQASQRGLLNSNLAAQSAQLAVLQEALPIAQQDAQTYYQQGRANQDIENEFLGRIQTTALDMFRDYKTGEIDIGKMQAEYAEKAKLLSQEMGMDQDTEAAKQNAALWAQFIQGAAEINTADMDHADKQAQIENLRSTTLEAMASNARWFGDADMLDFYANQMTAIDSAVNNVGNDAGASAGDGVDPNGNPYWVVDGRRYYQGDELPAGKEWIRNSRGLLDVGDAESPWADMYGLGDGGM